MRIRVSTITGPDYWASYFINGDASGLSAAEKAQADAWLVREGVKIVDVARDENGEPDSPRFTWHMRMYAPELGVDGGSVIDYVAHEVLNVDA